MTEIMQPGSAPGLAPSWLSRLDNITDQLDVLLRLVSERMEDRNLPIADVAPIIKSVRAASNSPNTQLSSILHQLRRSTNECESSAAVTQAVNVAHVASRGSPTMPPMTGRYSSPGQQHGNPLVTPSTDKTRRASMDVYSSPEPFRLSPSAHLSPAAQSSGGLQSKDHGRSLPLQDADCGDVPTPRFTPAPGQTFSPVWSSVEAPIIPPIVPSTASLIRKDVPKTVPPATGLTHTTRHGTDTPTLQAILDCMGLAVAADSTLSSLITTDPNISHATLCLIQAGETAADTVIPETAACSHDALILSSPPFSAGGGSQSGSAAALAATEFSTSLIGRGSVPGQQPASGLSLSGLQLQLKGLGLNPHAAEFVLPTPRGCSAGLQTPRYPSQAQQLQLQLKQQQATEQDVDRDGSQTARHDQNRHREMAAPPGLVKDGSQTARGERNPGRGRAGVF